MSFIRVATIGSTRRKRDPKVIGTDLEMAQLDLQIDRARMRQHELRIAEQELYVKSLETELQDATKTKRKRPAKRAHR